jgi:hypothetical protein
MRRSAWLALTLVPLSVLAAPATSKDVATLFTQWREFQRPPRVGGVPDYSPKAMAAQAKALPGWLKRVDALDVSGAPLPLRNDVKLIRAEMNGLDFDHRVLSPWTRDPSFYVTIFEEQSDQPAREAEWADAAVELWALKFPLASPSVSSSTVSTSSRRSSPRRGRTSPETARTCGGWPASPSASRWRRSPRSAQRFPRAPRSPPR